MVILCWGLEEAAQLNEYLFLNQDSAVCSYYVGFSVYVLKLLPKQRDFYEMSCFLIALKRIIITFDQTE
jgi:hypothetical protein